MKLRRRVAEEMGGCGKGGVVDVRLLGEDKRTRNSLDSPQLKVSQ